MLFVLAQNFTRRKQTQLLLQMCLHCEVKCTFHEVRGYSYWIVIFSMCSIKIVSVILIRPWYVHYLCTSVCVSYENLLVNCSHISCQNAFSHTHMLNFTSLAMLICRRILVAHLSRQWHLTYHVTGSWQPAAHTRLGYVHLCRCLLTMWAADPSVMEDSKEGNEHSYLGLISCLISLHSSNISFWEMVQV